jgi:hypothetical protein
MNRIHEPDADPEIIVTDQRIRLFGQEFDIHYDRDCNTITVNKRAGLAELIRLAYGMGRTSAERGQE